MRSQPPPQSPSPPRARARDLSSLSPGYERPTKPLRTTRGFFLSNPAPPSPLSRSSKLVPTRSPAAAAESQPAFRPHSGSAVPDLSPAPSSPCVPTPVASPDQIAKATPARRESASR